MVQSDLFMSGNTSSCGCLKRRRGENSPKYTGYREISGCYWSQIKHAAKLRKLTFDVNIQFAWELFEKQNRRCAVSGVEIVFAPTSAGMSEGTASLDQIVAGHGYVDSNVHWTHKDVNRLKWDWPIDKLIEWCDRISAFQKKKRGEDGPAGID